MRHYLPPEALRKREAFNDLTDGQIAEQLPPEALRKREAFNIELPGRSVHHSGRLKLFGNARRSTHIRAS